MALSVKVRPNGYHLSSTPSTGTYTNGSSIITNVAHGLSSGWFIYISTGQGLGFWYVTKLTNDTFNIREYFGATVYTFIGSGTLTFYPPPNDANVHHAYNAVHLPMVYKLSSTLWPTNSVDTARTVSSYANDNGYVKLTLSGVITSTVTELEFVKVTFTGGTSAIYQILTWYSNSVVTINLAYIGGITFTSVQYYYNNYHAKIRIYTGRESTLVYGSLYPFTLVTEQKCVPDSNGLITLNVNEFVKQGIAILNNDLNKGTLPNNLDAFCQFYITYAEAYDYSVGGYTLLDFVGPYSDDSGSYAGTGVAINADLPFKNINSGAMTEYVNIQNGANIPYTSNLQKFLTPSLYPEISVGQFFDISYIQPFNTSSNVDAIFMKRELYTNGNLAQTILDTIPEYDLGVYRYEVPVSTLNEDRIDLTLMFQDYPGLAAFSETKTITVNKSCSPNYIDISWLNYLGGFDYWRFKSNSDYGVQIEGTTQVRKNQFTNWPKSHGAGADTIRQETSRDSSQTLTVRAEYITIDQINDLYRIMTSPLVQIVNSRTDRRTILPSADSFVYLQQSEKLFNLEINFLYTDNLPSQSL